jgi:hypothetical protein
LILTAFRHGLRASEICDLEWSQVEFGRSASLQVRRVKNGRPSVHPLRGDEIRALRATPAIPGVGVCLRHRARRPVHGRCGKSGDQAHRCAPALPSRCMRTCCATAAATLWPTATTHAPSRTGSAIARSSTLCATQSCRRRGLRIFGANCLRPTRQSRHRAAPRILRPAAHCGSPASTRRAATGLHGPAS